eukprot:1520794-Pyramimonas_sp.AAC.1
MTFAKASSSVVNGSGSYVTGSATRQLGGTQHARAVPILSKAPVGLARCSLKRSAWNPDLGARTHISSITGLSQAAICGARRPSTACT